ncbi:hypothetical protein [Actinoallomurus rhizosphaericola]|uniref:hypothetical protein n=1 Tax=Actinoallomurus rhizosphaericola TaxID=2952536 RepID=UPI0020935BD7|nr:hypothetical protein [Actinoallomurus rhizosphaericola]MCO5999777.1 hypothetical protein [Actinoallomurus rhizosphaericola]
MRHRLLQASLLLVSGLAGQATRIGETIRARSAGRWDRGANVVETIIIVAGFAILAAAIYAAVSGKVHAWIAKIP